MSPTFAKAFLHFMYFSLKYFGSTASLNTLFSSFISIFRFLVICELTYVDSIELYFSCTTSYNNSLIRSWLCYFWASTSRSSSSSSSKSISTFFYFLGCFFFGLLALDNYSLILNKAFLGPPWTQFYSKRAYSATLRLSFLSLKCLRSMQSLTHHLPRFSLLALDMSIFVKIKLASSYCLSFSKKSIQTDKIL